MLKYLSFCLLLASTVALGDNRQVIDTIAGPKATGYLGHTKAAEPIEYAMAELPADHLPADYDSRKFIKHPPIRDQGACGSCWAFASTRALEINLSKQKGEPLDLSEQDMVSCAKDAAKCSGGYMESANFLLSGITDEAHWPYKASNLKCKKTPKYAKAAEVKLLGSANKSPTAEEIKIAIYNYGSSFVTVAAGNGWGGTSGELPASACKSKTTNHMVTLVGWTDKDKWIMANSWGEEWGDKGYSLVPFGCAKIGEEAGYIVAGSVE